MKLPNVKYADRIKKGKQVKFGGLDHRLGAGDGDIWDMQNMTSDYYPLLSTRKKRVMLCKLDAPGGIYSMNGLCWVDGTAFYYNGIKKGEVAEGQKTFAALNSTVVIFPDKCYYNTETDTFGSLESKWEGVSLTFTNGLLYEEEAEANTIQCEGVDWAAYFREGDAITISGCTKHPENNKTPIIREIDGDKMYFYENIFTLDEGEAYTEEGELTISRTVPDLHSLCANENRLWGCDGSTIYASKQGDVFSWNVYDGIESDSWFLTPGDAGVITGGISYKGFSIFFKEEQIYKVYGTTPSTFKAVSSASMGLVEGSGKSLVIAGETLFYLSRNGVMAYSGGIPQPIGDAFGTERFCNAVGGSDGLKYYVSMQGEDGSWWLYVYDTQRGLWHKEDQMHVTHFTRHEGNLYFLNDLGEIWIIGDMVMVPGDVTENVTEEKELCWMVEFADFTEEDPNKKGVGKLQIRLELEEDASVEVWIQFDSDEVWRRAGSIIGEDPKRSYYLPIVPRRCDHYRLKLTGEGGCRVYSIAREYYSGSELKSKSGRN